MAHQTQEIPHSEWVRFLDDFTRDHEGWTVRIEVEDGAGGPSGVQVHGLPLAGVSADLKGSEHDVSVMVGNEDNPGLTHIIAGARRLSLLRNDRGSDDGLEIEASDGSRTRVRLQQVMRAG